MKKLALFFVALIFIGLIIVLFFYFSNLGASPFWKHTVHFDEALLSFDEYPLHIAIARTQNERTRGLSGLEQINSNEGMLFVFGYNDFHTIWMRDMNFPIDIIWLDDSYGVVDYKEHASPDSFRNVNDAEVFTSKSPARYVLEVQDGFISTFDVQIDDKFVFKNNIQ